jgi:hypothetical protein
MKTLSKIIPYNIDYEKVENEFPEKQANQKLLETTPFFDKKLSY